MDCIGLTQAPPPTCLYITLSESLNLYENGVLRGQLLLTPGFGHHTITGSADPAPDTPEPGTMLLLGSALGGVALLLRRRRTQ